MKTLLTICALTLITLFGYSQCNPDPSRVAPGNYTSMGEGLMNDAEVNKPYSETITFVPQISYDTFGIPIAVDSIMINKVTSLPTGLSFQTKQLMVRRGQKTCIQISGTPTTPSEVGAIDIVLDLTYYANRGNSIKHPKKLKLKLLEEKSVGVADNIGLEKNKLTVKTFPNPIISNATFQLTGFVQEPITLEVYDWMGKKVYSNDQVILDSENSFNFDASELSGGIYIYKLSIGSENIVDRLIITGQ